MFEHEHEWERDSESWSESWIGSASNQKRTNASFFCFFFECLLWLRALLIKSSGLRAECSQSSQLYWVCYCTERLRDMARGLGCLPPLFPIFRHWYICKSSHPDIMNICTLAAIAVTCHTDGQVRDRRSVIPARFGPGRLHGFQIPKKLRQAH